MPTLEIEQAQGRDFLAKRTAAILGDRAGFGKTAQAITAAQAVNAQRVLVLCPAVARLNWERELIMWGWDKPIIRVTSKADFNRPSRHGAEAVIASYDGARGAKTLRGVLNAGLWDVIVLDEAHRLKTPTSNQTRMVYGQQIDLRRCLGGKALRLWLLSASIMPNHAGELWTHLHALWPGLILDPSNAVMGYEQYLERYCNLQYSPYGAKIVGLKDPQGLVSILQHVMLRRERIEGLPAVVIRQDPQAVECDAKELARLEQSYEAELGELVSVLESAAARNQGLDGIDDEFIHLATLRRLTGLIKAAATAELIAESLMDGDKHLTFCLHRDVIDEVVKVYQKHGLEPAVIHGGVPDGQRNREIDRFQKDPRCRVMVGQIQACQEAITLTAANRVGFVEYPWSPEAAYQAMCRAYRRGQTRQVFVDSFSVPGSIDEQVAKVVLRKARMIDSLMNADYSAKQ